MNKKFLTSFMIMIFVVASFNMNASAAVKSGDYEYEVLKDGTVEITNYLGSGKKLVIPDEINGKIVTSIGENAFFNKTLTSVIIPDSVTNIKEYAFCYNNLTSVVIPDSVTIIGDWAFDFNKLTSVKIGKSVENIREYAFFGNKLTSVTIPDSVTSIGASAFFANKLTSVKIGKSVESIGESAFCKNKLTSVTIPDSVTNIDAGAFFANNKLTKVSIPSSVKEIGILAFGFKNTDDDDLTKIKNFTITGTKKSAAHTYATDNDFKFVDVNKKSIAKFSATLSKTSYTYNKKVRKPTVTLKDGKKALKLNTDYTVKYSNNTKVGTGKVTVTGKGNYRGTITKTFKIK